jgi:hypothetical protein
MTNEPPRYARGVLWSALAGLVASLLAQWIVHTSAYAKTVDGFYRVDPSTGHIVDHVPTLDRYSFQAAILEKLDLSLLLTGIALACMGVVFVALRRVDREHRLALPLILAPLALPLVIALSFGVLVSGYFVDVLADLHQMVSDVPLYSVPYFCTPSLDTRSYVLASDTVRDLAVLGGIALAAVLLVPGAWLARRAGERGHRLGPLWSRAAIACFILGGLALLSTRAHRHDRVALSTVFGVSTAPGYEPERPEPNLTSTDLQAVMVDRCEATPRGGVHPYAILGDYQLFATGEIAHLPQQANGLDAIGLDATWLRQQLFERLDFILEIADKRGEDPREHLVDLHVDLYADHRTPIAVLEGHLEQMRSAGVARVRLLGAAVISGELETVGAWQRYVHCPIGVLRFDEPRRHLHEFETVAELAAAVSARGSEGLRIGF